MSKEDELSEFSSAVNRFTETLSSLQANIDRERKELDESFKRLDSHINNHKFLEQEHSKLEEILWDAWKQRKKHDKSYEQEVLKYKLKLQSSVSTLKVLRTTPGHGSVFLRIWLGKIDLQFWKNEQRVRFRDEYNKFKSRTMLLFLLFPCLQLFVLKDPIHQNIIWNLHQVWLVYYYTSLALRELILKANGSTIKSWWIYHHYFSIIMVFTLLIWPAPEIESYKQTMLNFGLAQGVVMYLQNSYQKRRTYVRRSLGKAKAYDVDSTETLVEKPTDLKLLIPINYCLYGWELYMSYFFLMSTSSWQMAVAAACFAILATGNAVTTTIVLFTKGQRRKLAAITRKVKKSASNVNLSLLGGD